MSIEQSRQAHAALEAAVQALRQATQGALTVLGGLNEREQALRASLEQQARALGSQVTDARLEFRQLLDGAGDRIAGEARQAVVPAVAECGRAAQAAAAQLRSAGRVAWLGSGAALLVLLVALGGGWMLLSDVRSELAAARDELQRYENALPVVRAFYASDAVLCGERICANVDPQERMPGVEARYRPVRARPAAP